MGLVGKYASLFADPPDDPLFHLGIFQFSELVCVAGFWVPCPNHFHVCSPTPNPDTRLRIPPLSPKMGCLLVLMQTPVAFLLF